MDTYNTMDTSYFFILARNLKEKWVKTWEKMGKIKGAIGTATFLKRQNDSSVKRKKSKFMLQCVNRSQGSGRNSPHHFQHLRTAQSYLLWLTKVYVSSSITLLTSTLSSCTYCHCSSVSNSPSLLWNFKYKILRKSNFSHEEEKNYIKTGFFSLHQKPSFLEQLFFG